MKLTSLIIVILLSIHSVHAHEGDMVVVLMIKDEAHVIQQTLEPLVKGGVKQFFILDTGSTDGTQEIVRQFFINHNITLGYIQEEPFVDFATSRNRTLELAEQQFPEATFMLMLDANWFVNNVPSLLEFCKERAHEQIPCYLINVIDYATGTPAAYKSFRLFRANEHIRYHGVVHECIDKHSMSVVSASVWIDQIPGKQGQDMSDARLIRDRELLLKEYVKDPRNTRTLYYLGQTYSCLRDWDNAYKFYKLRVEASEDGEESYLAYYRLALVAEQLQATKGLPDWSVVLSYYLKAYALRAHRAEPLLRIALYYYRTNQRALSYLFARRALELSFPQHETELVECEMYTYIRYELVSICAWNVGAYDIGEAATRKALEVKPDMPHLLRNLALYVERKKSIRNDL